jgi:acid phosphatase
MLSGLRPTPMKLQEIGMEGNQAMRQLPLYSALASAVLVAHWSGCLADSPRWPATAPAYDHIVVVIEENKDYGQIDNNKRAAYLNELAASGASFSRMFGEEHNSQGNYFWLFSGDNQNVGFGDVEPKGEFDTSSLGQQLIRKGKSFRGYAEDLPNIGSHTDSYPWICLWDCLYVRKHVPWISFNLRRGVTPDTINLRFADFPRDYTTLPVVAFVVPNLRHDMHDGTIEAGDDWLRANLKPYADWAKDHNSLLIVTFDESDNGNHWLHLTDPSSDVAYVRNQIFTVFTGAHIKPGRYDEGNGITHVNILRTIEAMYGLPKSGKQQELAVKAGISDDYIITDVFDTMP